MFRKWFLFALILVCLALPAPALADGIIIPEPPFPPPERPVPVMSQLAVRYHHVEVTIQDQVAVTHVDQVFHNPNSWDIEGTYLFPVPVGAVVNAFTLWVDGQPVEGEVLEAGEARQKYQDIVNSLRDPALLEYAGRGAFQAHIFPIPAGGERRIELEYSEVLSAENGLVRYLYPLNTEKFSALPLENVSISVDIEERLPIRAAYSPSHPVDIQRQGDKRLQAGYEAQNVLPDTDFVLYYSLGEDQAFHMLSYIDPGEPDGYFLAMLAPRPGEVGEISAKDLILVLDRSGSMEGEKFQQAVGAARYILSHLNPQDRFNLITFSTGLEFFANRLRPASEAAEAQSWLNRQSAKGSTDINRALLEAAGMSDRERPAYLIFLTDGLPTEGEVDSQRILDNLAESAPPELRLFVFGVGYDVDTFLLDSLAEKHHGQSTYVLPGEPLDEILSSFYERVSTPVMTNLVLDFGDLDVYDLYPNPLPDLFRGSQVILVGRYRQGGLATLTLTGQVNNQPQSYEFSGQRFASPGDSQSGASGTQSAIPRLWATRKIGYLLNQVRLAGPDEETIRQIVQLSIRYGIVTPYTSYLVTEPMPLGAEVQEDLTLRQFNQMQAMPTAPASGQAAVEKAIDQGAMAGAEAPAPMEAELIGQIRQVGSRAFIRQGEQWIDTAYDPQEMTPMQVNFLSDDYYRLLEARPELSPYFALGSSVIVVSGETAFEVVESGAPALPAELSTPINPGSSVDQPGVDLTKSYPEPISPTAYPSPDKPGALPCLGGLLPALFVMIAVGAWRVGLWRRQS